MKIGRLVITVIVVGVLGAVIEAEHRASIRVNYSKAHAQIAALQQALHRYYEDNGSYPTSDQGLFALGEYYGSGLIYPELDPDMVMPRVPRQLQVRWPLDPWGRPYFYQSDGAGYELRSFGPNGFNGGEDKTLIARSP